LEKRRRQEKERKKEKKKKGGHSKLEEGCLLVLKGMDTPRNGKMTEKQTIYSAQIHNTRTLAIWLTSNTVDTITRNTKSYSLLYYPQLVPV